MQFSSSSLSPLTQVVYVLHEYNISCFALFRSLVPLTHILVNVALVCRLIISPGLEDISKGNNAQMPKILGTHHLLSLVTWRQGLLLKQEVKVRPEARRCL